MPSPKGEQSAIHRLLGALGVITDGSVRDIDTPGRRAFNFSPQRCGHRAGPAACDRHPEIVAGLIHGGVKA